MMANEAAQQQQQQQSCRLVSIQEESMGGIMAIFNNSPITGLPGHDRNLPYIILMHKFEFPLNYRTSYQKVRRGVSSRWSSNAEHDGTIKMTVREAVLQTGSWFNPDLINDTQTALLVLMTIDTCLEGRECCWTVNTGNRWALVSGFILDSSPLKGPKWTTFFICPPSILYLYRISSLPLRLHVLVSKQVLPSPGTKWL